MSTRRDSPVCDDLDGSSLDLSDGSNASYMDSDNSRDVNLNSKKFTDCNLLEIELEDKNYEDDRLFTTTIEDGNDVSFGEGERQEAQEGRPVLSPENNLTTKKTKQGAAEKKSSVPAMVSSTPKLETEISQPDCDLHSSGLEAVESQTNTGSSAVLNQSGSLSNEEIGKKFQDLSFAFKTDSMTIEKRLQLLKRKRDQAESNIQNELRTIKEKLKTLQYLGLNSEYLNVMTELKKQLDFVLNATMELSGSAEGYGYAQHEEKWLELATVMLRHVENVESSRNDSQKASEKLKGDSQRYAASFLDNSGEDDAILRRRSITAVALESNSRRRASIATLPRIGYSVLDSGGNGRGCQWLPNKLGAAKKLPFSQANPRAHYNGLPGIEDTRRDSSCSRPRKERRTSESSMNNIDESPEPEQTSREPESTEAVDSNSGEITESGSQLKQLLESIEEIRRNSGAQEHVTAVYCLRRIVEWNKLLLGSTRFRWPENVLHYVPFYITWYVVFVLTLVFIGGLFTGINGCYTYSCLKYSAFWFVAPAFYSLSRRYYRPLLPLFLTGVIVVTLFFLLLVLLIKSLLPQLTSEEIDSLFRTLGLEIHYLNGPPPI